MPSWQTSSALKGRQEAGQENVPAPGLAEAVEEDHVSEAQLSGAHRPAGAILLGHGAGQHDAGPLEQGLNQAGAVHALGSGAAGTVGGAVKITEGLLQGDVLGAAVARGSGAMETGGGGGGGEGPAQPSRKPAKARARANERQALSAIRNLPRCWTALIRLYYFPTNNTKKWRSRERIFFGGKSGTLG